MKQIKTLLAALFVAMAGTASAQTKNYVHITKTDGTKVHFSQDEIESMIIDTEEPEELKFVTFTDGTNTVKVAKKNLGATSVADGTSCYGDYYAWGATETFATVNQSQGTVTEPKDGGYINANAPYWDKDASAYTKYTSASTSASTLEAADDAVAANMPGWHMPTQEEFQTLYAACGGTDTKLSNPPSISSGEAYAQGIYWVEGATSSVTIGGDTYSANGLLFVQDATHHVFFPAAGSVVDNWLCTPGSDGNYWSSSLHTGDTDRAYYLNFGSTVVDPGNNYYRYAGFPVRPFKDAAPAPDPEPEADYVEFTSGTNTVKVATMNLGATTVADSPETSYGSYYAWGATETFGTVAYTAYNEGTVTATKTGGYSQDNAKYYSEGAYTKYQGEGEGKDGLKELEAEDDAVAANMSGWHMPTQAEIQTLFDACGGNDTYALTGTISANQAYPTTAGIYWVTGATTSPVTIGGSDTYSVNGMLFVQDATHHVFFPAAGYVNGTNLYGAGNYGYYWSSSFYEIFTDSAYRLSFSSYYVYPDSYRNRYNGFPVRPFKD